MANRLYVGNLPFKATDDEIREHFTAAGEIASLQILRNRHNNRAHGFGFIDMTDADSARTAVATLNEVDFQERKLSVCIARPESMG